MKCKELEDLLIYYYYDEIEISKKSEVTSHLQKCSSCMSSWERLRSSLDAIDVDEPEMHESFWQDYRTKVYKKIEAKKSFSTANFFRPRYAYAASMVMILLFTIFGGIRLYESSQEKAFISRNYELMRDIDMFEDFEIIQHLEEIEAIEEI